MTTETEERPVQVGSVPASDLEGMTREQVLAICRRAGLAATAWKRGRMVAVLTGAEPAPEPRRRAPAEGNVLAGQLEARRAEGDQQLAAKALASRLTRTGPCESTVCRDRCSAYAQGDRDAFGWQMCVCGHTQWAHAVGAKHA